MPTITTVDATWDTAVTLDAAELRRADTAMFLGDGSNNGVRGGIVYHGPNSLAVSVNGSDQVTVQAGAFVIPAATGLGVYRGALQSATSAVAIAARNATNPRIDLVVIQATGTNATVKTIEGTPSSSPSAPALPAQHVELARITVPAVGGGAVTVDSTWRAYATGLGGMLYVETSARLPGSGNQKGQRATALNDGADYRWNGTAWVARSSSSGVTAVAGVDSSAVVSYIREGIARVNVTVTTTTAQGVNASLFVLPDGSRPPTLMYDDLVNVTGEVPVRVHIEGAGVVRTQRATAAGDILRGKLVIPL